MKCSEIIEILEELAPAGCACQWDNPGLLAGRWEKEVRKVLLTVDTDDAAVAHAENGQCDMIISHHPLIFRPLKQVNDGDFIGKRLVSMLRADISCYAMHTNYDAAPGCMADIAAERIGILNGEPLEPMGELEGIPYGIGKIGMLKSGESAGELASRIKKEFGLPFMTVYGKELLGTEPVTKVAVCPGSGGSMIPHALAGGAQVLITGDISHHEGIDAAAQGLMILNAGHYGLEHIFMDHMEQYLKSRIKDRIAIEKMPVRFPEALL